MKCPTCGAENEASNRFCEQCGSRITPSGGFQPAPVDLASMPTAAGPTCPSCGAAVLPGEAFCDECGASLTGVAPVAAQSARNDAPTMLAAPSSTAGGAPAGDQNVICPSCGHQNLPGDRFCDNCGAALDQAPARPASIADAPTMMAEPQALNTSASPPAVDPLAATVEQPALTPDTAPAPEQAASAPAPAAPAEAAPAASAAQAPAAAPSAGPASTAQSDYEAAQQRLNDEIGRQQKIIEQFEQMQAMFGAATPPAVIQGLAEARDAKVRAEAELAALPQPAPAADPAEVTRLNDEIGRQQKIIEQFEQMQAMFGAATPPAVSQGLAEARDARARAEAELATLTGGSTPAAPSASATPAAAAPAEPPATMPTVDEAVPPVPSVAPPTSAPAAPAAPAEATAPAPPAIAAPRLVLGDGQEIVLPADKREIIVGREDPISGIFPEVDLTPHGGETGGVSRQHARLNHDDGQWTITDLNSTNYTRVDGTKIDPNVPVPIASGAKLQFGRVAMTFQI